MRRDLQRAARLYALLAGLAALGALGVAAFFAPEELAAGGPLAALGLAAAPCPGCALCGLSRAFSAALRLDLGGALALNPGVVVALPACAGLALLGPWWFARGARRAGGR